MKLVVCGKGGSGKSTVSALMAREMAARGEKVLVVDTDESNFGLYKQLGLPQPRDFMESFGGKRGLGGEDEEVHEIGRQGEALHPGGFLPG